MTAYATTFTVRGGFKFPLDMLRYDSCYPFSQEDVGRLDLCLDAGETMAVRARNPVTLEAVHKGRDWVPTADRWESFGWVVYDVKRRPL